MEPHKMEEASANFAETVFNGEMLVPSLIEVEGILEYLPTTTQTERMKLEALVQQHMNEKVVVPSFPGEWKYYGEEATDEEIIKSEISRHTHPAQGPDRGHLKTDVDRIVREARQRLRLDPRTILSWKDEVKFKRAAIARRAARIQWLDDVMSCPRSPLMEHSEAREVELRALPSKDAKMYEQLKHMVPADFLALAPQDLSFQALSDFVEHRYMKGKGADKTWPFCDKKCFAFPITTHRSRFLETAKHYASYLLYNRELEELAEAKWCVRQDIIGNHEPNRREMNRRVEELSNQGDFLSLATPLAMFPFIGLPGHKANHSPRHGRAPPKSAGISLESTMPGSRDQVPSAYLEDGCRGLQAEKARGGVAMQSTKHLNLGPAAGIRKDSAVEELGYMVDGTPANRGKKRSRQQQASAPDMRYRAQRQNRSTLAQEPNHNRPYMGPASQTNADLESGFVTETRSQRASPWQPFHSRIRPSPPLTIDPRILTLSQPAAVIQAPHDFQAMQHWQIGQTSAPSQVVGQNRQTIHQGQTSGQNVMHGQNMIDPRIQMDRQNQLSGEHQMNGQTQMDRQSQMSGQYQMSRQHQINDRHQMSSPIQMSSQTQMGGQHQMSGQAQMDHQEQALRQSQLFHRQSQMNLQSHMNHQSQSQMNLQSQMNNQSQMNLQSQMNNQSQVNLQSQMNHQSQMNLHRQMNHQSQIQINSQGQMNRQIQMSGQNQMSGQYQMDTPTSKASLDQRQVTSISPQNDTSQPQTTTATQATFPQPNQEVFPHAPQDGHSGPVLKAAAPKGTIVSREMQRLQFGNELLHACLPLGETNPYAVEFRRPMSLDERLRCFTYVLEKSITIVISNQHPQHQYTALDYFQATISKAKMILQLSPQLRVPEWIAAQVRTVISNKLEGGV